MVRKVLIGLALTGGCSFALMESLPEKYDPEKTEPRCTGTHGFAAWDVLNAAGWIIGALAFTSTETAEPILGMPAPEEPNDKRSSYLAVAVGAGVLHIISAVSGAKKAGACTDARAERDRWQRFKDKEAARRAVPSAPRIPADAGVDAVPIDAAPDAPMDAPPFVVDPEEPPRR